MPFDTNSIYHDPVGQTLLEKLKEKGYVETSQLLTGDDINPTLDYHLENSSVLHSKAISVNSGLSGVAFDTESVDLKGVLEANKNKSGKLLIPTLTGRNHWILLIVELNNQQAHITCWDPDFPPTEQKANTTEQFVQKVAKEVFSQATVKYVYAKEQRDSFSCGVRIFHKALKEADIDNAFTQITADNQEQLCVKFVEMACQTDSSPTSLRNDTLNVVADIHAPTVYLQSAAGSDSVQNVLKNKRQEQISHDENLAILLQRIYSDNPDILSEQAMDLAKSQLHDIRPEQLKKIKAELLSSFSYYKNQQTTTAEGSSAKSPFSSEQPSYGTFYNRGNRVSQVLTSCKEEAKKLLKPAQTLQEEEMVDFETLGR